MAWVTRDASGQINGVLANRSAGFADEELSDDDPAVVVYLATGGRPQSILSQDLMAQLTADDATKIQAAVSANPQFWLLWSAMQAQKDPMVITNARFLAGWAALKQVLGSDRMAAIATALGVTLT
jgi:hypothetical protein